MNPALCTWEQFRRFYLDLYFREPSFGSWIWYRYITGVTCDAR